MSASVNSSTGGLVARDWSSDNVTENQFYALLRALDFWNKANTPDRLSAFWVQGNMSTMEICSELDGSVIVLPENTALPFDNYICRCPNISESHSARISKSYLRNKTRILQHIPVRHSGGGRRPAMLATTGLLVVTALLAVVATAL